MRTASPTGIVLKNGRVIDPATHFDGPATVVVRDGLIAYVGNDPQCIPADLPVKDVAGALVTPGLVDMHAHCMVGLGDFCLPPDMVGVRSGVPIIVDAGTSSTTIVGLARRAIIDHPDTKTRVLALVDPSLIYLANKGFVCHHLMIAADERNIDVGFGREVVEANRDVVVGFKVRPTVTGNPHHSPFLQAAWDIASDLPIMVHLGEFPHTPVLGINDLLAALRPGDIITHAYRGGGGQLDSKGEPTAEYRAAYERGVKLDLGHSSGDFHYPTARRLISRGFLPHTISTDLNVFSVNGPVYSMSTTMSKIWALGVPLMDVIGMNTVNAAAILHRSHEFGSLAVGRCADISILNIEDGEHALSDGHSVLKVSRRLRAQACLRAGEWIEATHDREGVHVAEGVEEAREMAEAA